MKKVLTFTLLSMLLIGAAKAQHAIRASHAVNHPGEPVTVVDSVYDINIYNDHQAVLRLGPLGESSPLNVIFSFDPESPFNKKHLLTLNMSLMEVTGVVLMVADQPTIVITEQEDALFFSDNLKENQLVLSQRSRKSN